MELWISIASFNSGPTVCSPLDRMGYPLAPGSHWVTVSVEMRTDTGAVGSAQAGHRGTKTKAREEDRERGLGERLGEHRHYGQARRAQRLSNKTAGRWEGPHLRAQGSGILWGNGEKEVQGTEHFHQGGR